MAASAQRKAQIEKLLEEAFQLKTVTEERLLFFSSQLERVRIEQDLVAISKQIAALEAEYNQLPNVPGESEEEDTQFRAYFAALEKRFAIYDDPSGMIALRMQPGTLLPMERPAEGDWADDFEELNRFYLEPRFARPPAPDQSQPIIENVAAYLRARKKVVLLGEPGAGKSTTLRLLAKAIRRAYAPGSATPPTLPLYAALNQWQKGSSLMEFLQSQITGMASYQEEEGDKAKLAGLARHLPELIKAGRVVVLLDGLNELPGLERNKLSEAIDDERARMIERMAHDPVWEQTLCLLSCRIKDFVGDPVRWQDLHLQPLTRPQIEAFALTHYQDRDLTNQFIKDLYDNNKSREKLRELYRQPFYLVRLLNYYSATGILPDKPAQLLRYTIDEALEREVNERRTITKLEAEELKTRLSYLAFNMTDAKRIGSVDKTTASGWLFHIRDIGDKEEPAASRAEKRQAEKLIKQAEDASLLSDNGETVQFYHQLFQEYFTALYFGAIEGGEFKFSTLPLPTQPQFHGYTPLSKPAKNPYEGSSGRPVVPPTFVGRESVIRQIEEIWKTKYQLPPLILYGHRRMGKTSILRNLKIRKEDMLVFIDMQREGLVNNTAQFLQGLAEKIEEAASVAGFEIISITCNENFESMGNARRSLDKLLKSLEQQVKPNQRFIIAIDEFEIVQEAIQEGRLEPRLLEYFRAINQEYNWLGLIMAGLHELEEMSREYYGAFYGSAKHLKISYLEEEDARRLISRPDDPDFELEYEPELVDAIYLLTEGQPYLIQLLCSDLVDRWNQKWEAEKGQVEPVLRVLDLEPALNERFFMHADYYFEGVWRQVGEKEQKMMSVIADWLEKNKNANNILPLLPSEQARKLVKYKITEFEQALQNLSRRDLMRERIGYISFSNEAMRRWVVRRNLRNSLFSKRSTTTRLPRSKAV